MVNVTRESDTREPYETRLRIYRVVGKHWRVDAEGDHHTEGETRGEALRNMAAYLDWLDAK